MSCSMRRSPRPTVEWLTTKVDARIERLLEVVNLLNGFGLFRCVRHERLDMAPVDDATVAACENLGMEAAAFSDLLEQLQERVALPVSLDSSALDEALQAQQKRLSRYGELLLRLHQLASQCPDQVPAEELHRLIALAVYRHGIEAKAYARLTSAMDDGCVPMN